MKIYSFPKKRKYWRIDFTDCTKIISKSFQIDCEYFIAKSRLLVGHLEFLSWTHFYNSGFSCLKVWLGKFSKVFYSNINYILSDKICIFSLRKLIQIFKMWRCIKLVILKIEDVYNAANPLPLVYKRVFLKNPYSPSIA